MTEIKYSLRRGADRYEGIYHSRLKSWILKGKIKRDDALVWRSGLSGWRKPEEIEELKPYFKQWEMRGLGRTKIEEQLTPALFPKKQIKNILIIEDEEDLCWLLSGALSMKGYNISIANTKSEAMGYLKEAPDLVFLDLKLPDGDGMDILFEIEEITPQTPVVIISAYGSEERREEAKERGVYSFIDKPFTEQKILETIEQFQKNGEPDHCSTKENID